MRTASLLLLAALLCVLIACGTPGAPQPPSLGLPRPVDDLSAVRKGSKVFLTWTPAHQTTDRENIKHPGATLICRGVRDFPMVHCNEKISEEHTQVAHWTKAQQIPPATFMDTLPANLEQENPDTFAIYALDEQNTHGKSAGLSNQVEIPLAPTLPPPDHIEVQVTPDGPILSWNAPSLPAQSDKLQFLYRIYRRATAPPQKNEMIVGELPSSGESQLSFLDHSFEWQQTYVYRVTPVTQFKGPLGQNVQVEGDDSAPATVEVRDIFPPAVPTGVQAVSSGAGQKPFIDLTWAPNLESDLAGYNVFRHEKGTEPAKINKELAKSPAYRDENVTPGHTYFYSISAVDLRGNESGRSVETSEKIPLQQQ